MTANPTLPGVTTVAPEARISAGTAYPASSAGGPDSHIAIAAQTASPAVAAHPAITPQPPTVPTCPTYPTNPTRAANGLRA